MKTTHTYRWEMSDWNGGCFDCGTVEAHNLIDAKNKLIEQKDLHSDETVWAMEDNGTIVISKPYLDVWIYPRKSKETIIS